MVEASSSASSQAHGTEEPQGVDVKLGRSALRRHKGTGQEVSGEGLDGAQGSFWGQHVCPWSGCV